MELKVPPAGESILTVMISEWLVAEGDSVSVDQILVVLETDKINVEVPSPINGRIDKILKAPGDEAAIGEVIAELTEGAQGSVAKPSVAKAPATAVPAIDTLRVEEPKRDVEPPSVSPAARRVLEEAGVKAQAVSGTGPAGRITKEDAVGFVAGTATGVIQPHAPVPLEVSSTASQPLATPSSLSSASQVTLNVVADREEVVVMSPLRRKIAERLVSAQQTAAILTTFNEVDMSAVMALRQAYGQEFQDKHGVKLGFMSFFVKACVEALKAYPAVNAEIRGQTIVYKNHYDIGVAVGGGKGLVVPVLRDTDYLSFAEVELGIKALAKKAQDMKLSLADLEGGTFTISNGGIYGSMLSTPILNPPQSGILGLHNITERPVAIKGKVEIRPMMYLALSYDHRIIDGRGAVSFLVALKKAMEDPARLLLEI